MMKLSLFLLFTATNLVWGFAPPALQASLRRSVALNEGTNANGRMPLRKGSTCALITPFTAWGRIDVPGLEKLLQWHVDAGTDNLCVLGTTAEAAVMDMYDRAVLLDVIVRQVKGKIPILVGTGTINPEAVKEMTQQAMDMGADASLVVTPYYVKPPQRGLIKHFVSIADMGLPMILYNVPGRTGCNLSDESIVTLSQHHDIVGIKDATGDLTRLESLRMAIGPSAADDFLFLSGDDGTTKDFILKGGDGCISVTANIVPHMMTKMAHAALEGDALVATEINNHMAALHKNLFIESNPIACKWAAKRIGLIDSDYCKPPLDSMDKKYEPMVDAALKSTGFLGVSRLEHKLVSHDDLMLPEEERMYFG